MLVIILDHSWEQFFRFLPNYIQQLIILLNQENANHLVFNVKRSPVPMYSQDFLDSHRFVIHFTAQGLGSIILENYTRVTWQNFTVTELCLNYLYVDFAFTYDISLKCCYCLFQSEADHKIKT